MPTSRLTLLISLVLLAAFARLVPHGENFAPLTAMMLFATAYLPSRRLAIGLPFAARFISDVILQSTKYADMQSQMWSNALWVYGAMIAIAAIGLSLRGRVRPLTVASATLAGTAAFFVITNFGSWLAYPHLYARSLSGLMDCYVAAIPFFRNTFLSDVTFAVAFFGGFAVLERFVPNMRASAVEACV